MKIEIIPAILPHDFAELEDKIELIRGAVKTVQVDVCDGQFVPEPSWPYRKNDANFEQIIKEEIGLPAWEEINYEFDLMINGAEEEMHNWISAGASRLVLHIESKTNFAAALEAAGGLLEIGLALNIETPLESVEPYAGRFQFLQLMGIERIGFQGQKFDERVVEKIKAVRAKYPELPIAIDGGVSLETAPALIAAGVTRLIVGSAIFEADNPFAYIQSLKRL